MTLNLIDMQIARIRELERALDEMNRDSREEILQIAVTALGPQGKDGKQ